MKSGSVSAGMVILMLPLVISFTAVDGAGAKPMFDQWLDQGQLTDIAALVKRQREATAEDEQWAKADCDRAEKDVARGKYSGAAKSFTEAALKRPSLRALLGLSLSLPRMNLPRKTCYHELVAKLKRLHDAWKIFDTAVEFHKILGEKSDVSDETISSYQRKLKEARTTIRKFGRNCLGAWFWE